MCEPWAEVFPLAGWMREEANGTRTVLRGQDSTAQTVWLYPAITAPVSNKDRKDLVPPEEHFEKLRAFQVDCAKYLFLGTSGLDDHILRLIGNGCGGERPLLCNVSQGSDSEVGAVTERLAGGLTAGAQRELNFERWQWGGGFNAWVQAVNFSDFLEA